MLCGCRQMGTSSQARPTYAEPGNNDNYIRHLQSPSTPPRSFLDWVLQAGDTFRGLDIIPSISHVGNRRASWLKGGVRSSDHTTYTHLLVHITAAINCYLDSSSMSRMYM